MYGVMTVQADCPAHGENAFS